MSAVAALRLGSEDPSIVGLLDELYAVISFEEGDDPNWSGLQALFSEHARVTRVTPDGTDFLTPQTFLAMTQNMLEIGVYTSFYEFEVARRIDQFGSVAQVWSLYETRRNRAARDALSRGVNSIQLVRENGAWRMLGLLWDETRAESTLDFSELMQQGRF
jgi:hypothetical protein